jgi:hypothetical protein
MAEVKAQISEPPARNEGMISLTPSLSPFFYPPWDLDINLASKNALPRNDGMAHDQVEVTEDSMVAFTYL